MEKAYNRASKVSWAKKEEEELDEIEAAFALSSGPGHFADDKEGFWERFKDHVEANDLGSSKRCYEAERGGLHAVESAFEFMRMMGDVPEWAHEYCQDHVMVPLKEKDSKKDLEDAEPVEDEEVEGEDEYEEEYRCENCWMREAQ